MRWAEDQSSRSLGTNRRCFDEGPAWSLPPLHRDIASTMVYGKVVRNSGIQARLNKGSLAAFA
jgi:hypothetical protein